MAYVETLRGAIDALHEEIHHPGYLHSTGQEVDEVHEIATIWHRDMVAALKLAQYALECATHGRPYINPLASVTAALKKAGPPAQMKD
jgi:hypothetical protein